MQDKERCSECQEKFDGGLHAPRDVGCGPSHYMCLKCLNNHLKSDRRIECYLHEPVDKIIDLKYKSITDFPALEFSKTNADQTFCSQHGNMNNVAASFICLECPAKVCLACSQGHSHDLVSIAEIASKRKSIENSMMNRFDIIEEAKVKERDYKDRKSQIEKSIKDEGDRCIKEFQSQINFIQSHVATHLDTLHRRFQKEFAFIEKDLGPWRDGVIEKVKKYSTEDPELALRNLSREQKDREYKANMNEYEQRVTNEIQAFQKEMNKISINFFQKFSEFVKKDLFKELNSIGDNQQEEKGVRFNLENGYKAFKKEEPVDPKSLNRSQINQPQNNPKERGRSKSKDARDNRGRSGSRNKNKFEEHKLSDHRPATSHIRQASNSNGAERARSVGLDSLANSIQESFENLGIPLTVKNDGGLAVKTVDKKNKSSINNDTVNMIQQVFVNRSAEDLKAITQVDFICGGLCGSGVEDLGNIIPCFENLISLSIRFEYSEKMNPSDLISLEKAFSKLNRLQNFKISFAKWKAMTNKVLHIFLEKLIKAKNLKTLELDLSHCFKLSDAGIEDGIVVLSSLAHLERLNINMAEYTNEFNCAAEIKSHFRRMPKLKRAKIEFGKGASPTQNDIIYDKGS